MGATKKGEDDTAKAAKDKAQKAYDAAIKLEAVKTEKTNYDNAVSDAPKKKTAYDKAISDNKGTNAKKEYDAWDKAVKDEGTAKTNLDAKPDDADLKKKYTDAQKTTSDKLKLLNA